jgi:hypothetical protein
MKPHIWFERYWWRCALRGSERIGLGVDPLDAYKAWYRSA